MRLYECGSASSTLIAAVQDRIEGFIAMQWHESMIPHYLRLQKQKRPHYLSSGMTPLRTYIHTYSGAIEDGRFGPVIIRVLDRTYVVLICKGITAAAVELLDGDYSIPTGPQARVGVAGRCWQWPWLLLDRREPACCCGCALECFGGQSCCLSSQACWYLLLRLLRLPVHVMTSGCKARSLTNIYVHKSGRCQQRDGCQYAGV